MSYASVVPSPVGVAPTAASAASTVVVATTQLRPRASDGGCMYLIRDGLVGGAGGDERVAALRAAMEAARVPDVKAMPSATRRVACCARGGRTRGRVCTCACVSSAGSSPVLVFCLTTHGPWACRKFYEEQNDVIDNRLRLLSNTEREIQIQIQIQNILRERAAVRATDAVGEVKLNMMWQPADNAGARACVRACASVWCRVMSRLRAFYSRTRDRRAWRVRGPSFRRIYRSLVAPRCGAPLPTQLNHRVCRARRGS
jgi:hypothetical protein